MMIFDIADYFATFLFGEPRHSARDAISGATDSHAMRRAMPDALPRRAEERRGPPDDGATPRICPGIGSSPFCGLPAGAPRPHAGATRLITRPVAASMSGIHTSLRKERAFTQ